MQIKSMVDLIKSDNRCTVLQPMGLPQVPSTHQLPDDVAEFYTLCGGILLGAYTDPYSARIVAPNEVTQSNSKLLGDELLEYALNNQQADRSWNWYIIVDYYNGDCISIDLSKERNGRCYDSFHETYGFKGDMPIVAFTFSALLEQFYNNIGQHWFWLDENFPIKCDAYDE